MAMTRRPARIELEIGELVLHGFAPADRHRIGDAVRQELARLLAATTLREPVPPAAAAERLDAGTIRLEAGAGAARAGQAIARAVHGIIGMSSATGEQP